MNRRCRHAAEALLAAYTLFNTAAFAAGNAPARFAVAKIRFEQNATDGDVEVVLDIIGRKDGIAQLNVVAPDGRTVLDLTAPAPTGGENAKRTIAAGIRQFKFESPEPTDHAAVKAAYPAGEYRISGTTVAGAQLESKAVLDHTLPATTSFVVPAAEAHDVPIKGVTIKWARVEGVASYAVELSGDDASIELRLPPTATSFKVPDGFLQPESEYQLGIGTVAPSGNVSFVETEFATAAAN